VLQIVFVVMGSVAFLIDAEMLVLNFI
jgi:hypothetical protein